MNAEGGNPAFVNLHSDFLHRDTPNQAQAKANQFPIRIGDQKPIWVKVGVKQNFAVESPSVN
jgi:hypothetical protein